MCVCLLFTKKNIDCLYLMTKMIIMSMCVCVYHKLKSKQSFFSKKILAWMTMSDTTTIDGHMTYTMAIFGSLYVCVCMCLFMFWSTSCYFIVFFCIFVFILDDRVIVLIFFLFFLLNFGYKNQINQIKNRMNCYC